MIGGWRPHEVPVTTITIRIIINGSACPVCGQPCPERSACTLTTALGVATWILLLFHRSSSQALNGQKPAKCYNQDQNQRSAEPTPSPPPPPGFRTGRGRVSSDSHATHCGCPRQRQPKGTHSSVSAEVLLGWLLPGTAGDELAPMRRK